MARLSDAELKKRKASLGQEAHAALVKSGVVHFRLEPHNIERIYEVAATRKIRMGQMVREWVLERLEAEMNAGEKLHDSSLLVSELISPALKKSHMDNLDKDDLLIRLKLLERLLSAQADRIDKLETLSNRKDGKRRA